MANKIEVNVLKVFNEKKTRNGSVRLHVIRWGNYSPQLEKREYYFDTENNEKPGKAKGLNHEDLQLIIDNAEEIQKLLES